MTDNIKKIKLGIIGGTGFDDAGLLSNYEKKKVHTPYGATSDLVVTGTIDGVDLAAISRHGESHTLIPGNVNFRANIWAMKDLGVTHIIGTTACGSLREDIKPGDLVFVDQFIDRSYKREQTFYEGTLTCHITMAEPFCFNLRKLFMNGAKEMKIPFHEKGTMVSIEGPRFSTKAESHLFRQWGCDVINMTIVPECILARELGIHYASIAMVTDYDCWKERDGGLSVDEIMATIEKNTSSGEKLIFDVLKHIKSWDDCGCDVAHKYAML